MKITFKDGSFLSINEADNPEKLSMIVCGLKGPREVTMSSLELDSTEVQEIVEFLRTWLQENQ